MAKAKVVVADQNSAEVDQLRKTVNALLVMLETAKDALPTPANRVEKVLASWADGIAIGKDSNPNSYSDAVATNVEIVGLQVTPRHPDRPGNAVLGTLDKDKL